VEAALLFNEKKYPPMLPRILRVVRAKAIKKTALASQSSRPDLKKSGKPQIYNPKLSSQVSSLQGRAGKLLGRAGAAQFKKREGSGANDTAMGKRGDGKKAEFTGKAIEGIARTPENIVFEGFRANSNSKPSGLKLGGKGSGKKGKGKPVNRGSKRAAAWKKGGVKKA
jgi:nucleolar protein 12